MNNLLIQTKGILLLAKTDWLLAANDPGATGNKIMGDVKKWLLAFAGGFAVVQFILAMFDYMSKDMQKQAQGRDHALRACIGLVGAFSAATIMTYLETQAKSWNAMAFVFLQFLS